MKFIHQKPVKEKFIVRLYHHEYINKVFSGYSSFGKSAPLTETIQKLLDKIRVCECECNWDASNFGDDPSTDFIFFNIEDSEKFMNFVKQL